MQSGWIAAAAATAGLLGGAAALALCETAEEHSIKRTFTKSGLKDPMTSYAVYAMKKEMEESDQQEEEEDVAALQATSAVNASSQASAVPVPLAAKAASSGAAAAEMTPEEVRLEEATRKAKQHAGGLKLFSGNGNMSLALEISRHLGISIGRATVGRFADGEVNVVVQENVRGKDVYIVQPTCPPVNDNIMELLLMVSTLRRSSARRITVVIPYYGYARQDRKMQVRLPFEISELAVARRFLTHSGLNRLAFQFRLPTLPVCWSPWVLTV